MSGSRQFTRRQLVLGGVVVAGLAACSDAASTSPPATTDAGASVPDSSPTRTPTSTADTPVAAGSTQAPPPPPPPTSASPPTSPRGANGSVSPPTSTGSVGTANRTAGALPPPPAAGEPAIFVDHGPRDGKAVSLTYHASGDPATATALLDLLQAHDVRVTVFAVGQWLLANPGLGKRIVDDGHELGNHTKTHQSMGSLNGAALAAEIGGGAQALVPFIGGIGDWFRPSGIVVPTAKILAEAAKVGYAYSIGYDLDTLDFQDPGAAAVLTNFQRSIQPGSIVSMHFGHPGTVEATPRILQHLDSIGLRHVTLSELFGRPD